MLVTGYVWAVTIVFIVALLAYDLIFHVRKAHEPTLGEAARWSAVYVGIALLFGVFLWWYGGAAAGAEYFAGYVTEKALSVDNLFVFLVIMSSFSVPRVAQQKVLLFGIVFALIARSAFIFAGAALIDRFSWVFYIFGLILLVTGGKMLVPEDEKQEDEADNIAIKLARKFLKTSKNYNDDKFYITENGQRVLTPMLLVMVAIGGTDILFALDSIPAIYGLTTSPYIVFTATAFSLLGLRQLYFLIDGLLDRLIYLSYGLAAILAFIGVKLTLHALHENTLWFINDGEPVHVIEVTTGFSLTVIIGVLAVTVVASLLSPSERIRTLSANAAMYAKSYLQDDFEAGPAEREEVYSKLMKEVDKIKKMPDKYRVPIREDGTLPALVDRAERVHAEVQSRPA